MKGIVKSRKISYNGKFYYNGEKVEISKEDVEKYSNLVEFEKDSKKKLNKKDSKATEDELLSEKEQKELEKRLDLK